MFGQEEKPKNLEQEVADLKEDIDLLRKRVFSLEDEMRNVKEQLGKLLFAPGL
jgi:FtsZ-binding cell division protein ZapB